MKALHPGGGVANFSAQQKPEIFFNS